MKPISLIASFFAFLTSCSPPAQQNANVFTLSTGIVLEKVEDYEDSKWIEGKLSLQKTGNDYLVVVTGYFSCGALKKPYLIDREKRTTLVIWGGGCSGGCECGRALTIRISDRAKPGDTLYVVNEDEVLGHFVLP
jgi:hypothetical protein